MAARLWSPLDRDGLPNCSSVNNWPSTTPESTIAALQVARPPRIFLLAGGHDKGFDFTEMVEAIGRVTVGAAFYGGG